MFNQQWEDKKHRCVPQNDHVGYSVMVTRRDAAWLDGCHRGPGEMEEKGDIGDESKWVDLGNTQNWQDLTVGVKQGDDAQVCILHN